MKQFFLFSLILGLLFAPVTGVCAMDNQITLQRISPEQITALKKKVESDIEQDTWKKRLVFMAALAAGGYIGYRYWFGTPAQIPAVPASADQLHINNNLLQVNNELLQKALPEMQQTSSSSFSWLKESTLGRFGSYMWELGKWTVQQSVTQYIASIMLMGSSSALGKVVDAMDNGVNTVSFNLFHERDLTWFLISRARVANLFSQLESQAQCLDTGTIISMYDIREHESLHPLQSDDPQPQPGLALEPMAYNFYRVTFAQTWNQIIQRVASLVAFIEHAADNQENDAIQERMRLGAQQLVAVTNATAGRLETALAHATLEHLPQDMAFNVRRLCATLSDVLQQVNTLEHEVTW